MASAQTDKPARFARALLVVVVGATTALGMAANGTAHVSHAAGVIVRRLPVRSAAALRHYWTPARMRKTSVRSVTIVDGKRKLAPVPKPDSARVRVPARAPTNPLIAATHAATSATPVPAGSYVNYPTSTHGILFGHDAAGDFACSGTSIASRNGSVVWTAGHCVLDPHSGNFVTQMIFVPAYFRGDAPLGQWPVRGFTLPAAYRNAPHEEGADYAAVVVAPISGETLVSDVGGRGIEFNANPSATTYDAFGYPGEPKSKFDGETMQTCRSTVIERDAKTRPEALGINCDMGEGSSGGGMIAEGTNVLSSNIAYGYEGVPDRDYGPYLDDKAQTVYETAQASTEAAPLPATSPPASPTSAPHKPADTTPPLVTRVAARPSVFSPRSCKASSKTITKLTWTTDEDTSQTIVLIKTPTGQIGGNAGPLAAGSWYVPWNGCSSKGRLERPGTYKFSVTAVDLVGNAAAPVTGKVTIKR